MAPTFNRKAKLFSNFSLKDLPEAAEPISATKKKEKIYTKLTFKAWCTFTLVVIHLVHTSPVVLAGFGGTFVDVQIAVVALEPWHAETLVHVHTVFADGPILTRLRVTFINVLIAVGPPVPGRTLAPVPSVQDVRASASVLTSLL